MNTLHNIERSIREFNIERAVIEWVDANSLSLRAVATAYYMDESSVKETAKTISPDDNGDKDEDEEDEDVEEEEEEE
jgi:hypothetical protein